MVIVWLVSGRSTYPAPKRRLPAVWLLSAIMFVAVGPVFYMLWPLAFGDGGVIADKLGSFGITRQIWPMFALYIFRCANVLVEETFWRGWLFQDSRRPTLRDAAFAGYHSLVLLAFGGALWAAPVFAGCLFAGWLWRMMRTATGGLGLPVLTHLIADAGIVTAVHLRVFP